jgi:ribosome-binding factor A
MSKVFRKEMIESDIRKIMSDALRELKNESFPKELLSFTRVNLSKDKRYADIYVSILPPAEGEETRESLFDKLEKYKGYFRKFIAQNTRMYTVPELRMILDKGIEQSVRMQKLLDSLNSSDPIDQES